VSARRDLADSLIATGVPFAGAGNFEQWSKIAGEIAPRVAGIRRFGSAALDLCYVACGRFDGFWELKLRPWDTAAGTLLVAEAGGRVTRFDGGPFDNYRPECLASNGRIHEEMMGVLALEEAGCRR